jgi:transposase InsO family protein
VSEKYEFIEVTLTEPHCPYPIHSMCRWLEVSRSGFHDWRTRPASATARRREQLRVLIGHVFDASEQTYGYRRVHAELGRLGTVVGADLVRHLMGDLGLVPCQPRPWRAHLTEADPTAAPVPDLLGRDFTAETPGTKLVGDITYIPTWEGWVYLATVIDCYSKKIVGYALDDHYRTPLISTAIRRATAGSNVADGAIFHTDRGSNYTSHEFHTTLNELGMRHSVGRTGICYDNAMAESFFAALKNELVHRTVYPTRGHAIRDITRYIDHRYNSRRLHSGLAYRTPNEVHNAYHSQNNAA